MADWREYNTKVTFEIPLHIETIQEIFFTWTYPMSNEEMKQFLLGEIKRNYKHYPEWYFNEIEILEVKQNMKQEEIDLWIKEYLEDE